ncbi:hypothetical protein F7725_022387 [Dissostichus mawsoni]|uniref:tRNA-specific adenosine deaminase 1 n=1 Tax=Dissostichus mawsoni TaxID=36200 RepID=A0A7J5YXM9_DISMA|nr:hypothetical protein F7725_022387 [Dissostichus mawsoni]
MVDADEIAKLCYERFQQLPRRGKPEPGREWTLLAAVLRITRRANSDTGEILNDSHAEVIARRGCVSDPGAAQGREWGGSAVFCQAEEQGKWRLHPGVSFLFFTSHTPCESCSLHVNELNLSSSSCGDAAIIAMNGSQSQPCPPSHLHTALKKREEEEI